MILLVRDSTNEVHTCDVDERNIHDARNRILLNGVKTEAGEWLNPAHVVSIREPSNG
jgi:hypothetical protein